MKKILLIAVSLVLILSLAACGGNKKPFDNKENNDDISVEFTDEEGKLSIDEDGVKSLLSVYSDDALGLSADVYDYTFRLSETTLNDELACKAEATLGESKNAEGVFVIVGETCYKYDAVAKKYVLLTLDGVVETDVKVGDEDETKATTESTTSKYKTDEQVAEENNDVLKKRYAGYNLKKIGIEKDINEYEFQVTGKSAVAADGESVYVIYLLEDGAYTEFKFAVNDKHDYYYDAEDDEYKILK